MSVCLSSILIKLKLTLDLSATVISPILSSSRARSRWDMSEVGVILQERETRTIMALLSRTAEEEGRPRRRTLKDRLRFGCCGAIWVFRPLTHPQQQHLQETVPNPTSGGMNLAAALAAERQLRGTQEPPDEGGERSGTPWRVSLMRLLQETEEKEKGGGGGEAVGDDSVCCVCMGRNKGAAFIPCGHTFCRVCSRELWLNRGTCPLCNRSILEILDIF